MFMRNSKCQHAVAELDGQGSKGALTVEFQAIRLPLPRNFNDAKCNLPVPVAVSLDTVLQLGAHSAIISF